MERFHRRSIRLPGYDYAQNGHYFVTICTKNQEHIFGDVDKGNVRLNEFGVLVQSEWENTNIIRENVFLDYFVVMPNHFHGWLLIM